MVQPGIGGLDTPQTNIGDATYLGRQPDFDISQEASFQSPSKDANIFQQLRNGGRPNLRTPRGSSRAPFGERRNLPSGIGGAEFTPLLKSATRNSVRRYGGKENGLATPAMLGRIDEDMTPIPAGESSVYVGSRSTSSYVESTPLPQVESSSPASTPLVMRTNRDGKGPLQDGQQLSLREQENVIDKIEKENFGLKLKIHFLEEALRKAGPGFSEAALRENTELKVDKVTMQRELQRYKKHLTSAEKELESYRQQILEVQEKARTKYANEDQRGEIERLRRLLEDRDADVEDLQRRLREDQKGQDNLERLQDEVADLEADIREKDRIIGEREDELDELRSRVQSSEDRTKDAQRKMVELEERAQAGEKLHEARETIEDLESDIRQLEQQLDGMKDKLESAVSEKDRAEADLEELQEEMANKSVVTKGLSRQVEEKIDRLQGELEQSRDDYSAVEKRLESKQQEVDDLRLKLKESREERDSSERQCRALSSQLEGVQAELRSKADEKALLQTRHDALTNESSSLQREMQHLQKSVSDLEEDLAQERQHALEIERDIRAQYKSEIDRLNDEISDLQAEVRERENLYDNDSEKWETERHNLESERDRAEERASSLQSLIDKLRETEGNLSNKEAKLQEVLSSEAGRHKKEEAVLARQIEELQQNLDTRQGLLEDLRNELSLVRDELRQAQLDTQTEKDKAGALEDEIEILQSTLDEETDKAAQGLDSARRECDDLKRQLRELREASKDATRDGARHASDTIERLNSQLADAQASLAKANRERQSLQDQLAKANSELQSLRASLAGAEAERDEVEAELERLKQTGGGDTFRLDQERVDLRTAKARLDNEVRRLKEDNKLLTEQQRAVEKTLEDEIDKAASEEERLNQEILDLQAKLRQPSGGQELVSARRTIRDLEHRLRDAESTAQLPPLDAGDSSSELSQLRHDLADSRAKERELLQRVASHQDTVKALKRQIADLEHRLHEAEMTAQLPALAGGDGNSEVSLIRRDLSDARAKEREFMLREASHKDTVRTLKRQIADLERRLHDAEMTHLVGSPASEGGSARKAEVSELRHQLTAAHQSIHDLKKSLREAERKAASSARELQAQLDDLEDQKLSLEQALEDAQQAAEEAATEHKATLKRAKQKLERYKRERDSMAAAVADNTSSTVDSETSREERHELHAMLRKTQIEADALEHEVREHRDALNELMQVEQGLRRKLDRAREERALYRADAEKLQRDVQNLKAAKEEAEAAAATAALARTRRRHGGGDGVDTDAIIRAAEAAEQRHIKELRGASMQIEWMQARWEREAQLRADAAYAKRYLLLELDIRDACNKADLRKLDGIMSQLGLKGRPGPLPPPSSRRALAPPQGPPPPPPQQQRRPMTLKRLATAVRFVVRCRTAAQLWAKHERTRQRLAEAVDERERARRIKRLRDEWRAQVRARPAQEA